MTTLNEQQMSKDDEALYADLTVRCKFTHDDAMQAVAEAQDYVAQHGEQPMEKMRLNRGYD